MQRSMTESPSAEELCDPVAHYSPGIQAVGRRAEDLEQENGRREEGKWKASEGRVPGPGS